MVAQNVFHRASSHQIIDLWRFADRCNIPWNRPTNFHSDLIATIQQRYLLLLCALPFQQYHLFLIVKFDVQWFQDKSSQALPNYRELSCVTLHFHVGSKNCCSSFLFMRSFCFARIRLNPLSCQILHHDSVSVIVLRFTSFTKNFVIGCYQEVRLRQCVFCKEPLLSWSSCRCRNFGPSGSEYKYCAFPKPLFLAALKLIHEMNSLVRLHELEHFHAQDSP